MIDDEGLLIIVCVLGRRLLVFVVIVDDIAQEKVLGLEP